jgi:hypothetical protein
MAFIQKARIIIACFRFDETLNSIGKLLRFDAYQLNVLAFNGDFCKILEFH